MSQDMNIIFALNISYVKFNTHFRFEMALTPLTVTSFSDWLEKCIDATAFRRSEGEITQYSSPFID